MIYEINFLVLQSQTAELEKIRKDVKKFVESFGAEIVEEKEYLKRKLAYEIKHENYGFFTVLRFKFKENKNLDELKIKLNQKAEVARYIIVQAENLPSLKEQETKELEKTQINKKSIKSEDVEKILTEEKKAKITKAKKKAEPAKIEEKEIAVEEEKAEVVAEKEPEKEAAPQEEEKASAKKVRKEAEEKEEVSLDELDKKLDEILNS